jgi:mannose-6-phosphate isomerase
MSENVDTLPRRIEKPWGHEIWWAITVQGTSVETLTERTVSIGDVWRNLPGTIHTIEALEDADVLEASTPYLDDVVRLRDDYGREGTSAI